MNVELTDTRQPENRIVLSSLPAIIGSGSYAHVCLDDPEVDACHCMLDQIDGTLLVSDLVSRNGTRVNARRVDESPLVPGDELAVGNTFFFVRYQRSPDRRLPGQPR